MFGSPPPGWSGSLLSADCTASAPRPSDSARVFAHGNSRRQHHPRVALSGGSHCSPSRALSIHSKCNSSGRLATGGILIKPYGSIGSAPVHTVVRRQLKRVDGQKRKTFQIVSLPLQTLACFREARRSMSIGISSGACLACSRRAFRSISIERWSMQSDAIEGAVATSASGGTSEGGAFPRQTLVAQFSFCCLGP